MGEKERWRGRQQRGREAEKKSREVILSETKRTFQ
jgi:hypothetical protein